MRESSLTRWQATTRHSACYWRRARGSVSAPSRRWRSRCRSPRRRWGCTRPCVSWSSGRREGEAGNMTQHQKLTRKSINIYAVMFILSNAERGLHCKWDLFLLFLLNVILSVTPCLKCGPTWYPSEVSIFYEARRVGYGWMRVYSRPDRTFKQDVMNLSPALPWLVKKIKYHTSHCWLPCDIGCGMWYWLQTLNNE